jgi:hypothetical protein
MLFRAEGGGRFREVEARCGARVGEIQMGGRVWMGWVPCRLENDLPEPELQGSRPGLVDIAVPSPPTLGERGRWALVGGASAEPIGAGGRWTAVAAASTVELRCGRVGGQELHRRVDRLA